MNRALVCSLLFFLSTGVARGAADAVQLTRHETSIDVTIGGKPFTTYYFTAGGDKQFVRPYMYPVFAADGTPLTSDQARVPNGDHPHHRSFYIAHGDVNGVDHWAITQPETHPNQRHIAFEKIDAGTIVERLAWESADRKSALLNETRTLRFFPFEDGCRGVDITVALTPAGTEAVTLGDTKEAGMCAIRFVKELADQGTITNSLGQTGEKETWGKPADWCDLTLPINGKLYGATILDHPSNPKHPARWHVRQYGLLAANIWGLHEFDKSLPAGAGAMKLEPGSTTTFRYRVVFHEGDAKAAKLGEKFEAYVRTEAK